MTYAIFGYKGDNDYLGDFLAEVKNKTLLVGTVWI